MRDRRPLDDWGPRSWTRPEAIAFGRLPMSTFLRRDVLSLDGEWHFTLRDRPEAVTVDDIAGDHHEWDSVEVPGCWTMQGYDRPQYTNVQMPFPGPAPSVPDDNPTGVYRRTVTAPPRWRGQRIVLQVGGAESVLYVHVDGEPLAMGTDSRLPHDIDLTSVVEPGKPFELALTVVRWSAAVYLEDQDHWYHAGLHRSVLLYTTPLVRLADVHAVADWDPDAQVGHLGVRASVEVDGAGPRGWRLRVSTAGIEPLVGDVRWEHPDRWWVTSMLFDGRRVDVEAVVPDVQPWSAEHPNLRDVLVELLDDTGAVRDDLTVQVGFRRVEIRGHELLINGRAVLIKGVNRHDHDERRGKAVTCEGIEVDVELMKANNLNAIRTSHYPNDPHLYDVCDRLGMYVIDEANIETHALLRSLTHDPRWTAPMLERVTRMAQRDKNHPSIVMWSLGNESGASAAHDAAATWLRAYDPTRPVHYEGGLTDGEARAAGSLSKPEVWRLPRSNTDVLAPMYPSVEDLVAWATMAPPDRPLIMCEYIHAMNNSCGGLDEYWEAIEMHAGLQGGFVWDWVDQALVQTMPDGRERWAYGGDFGDEPNDGPFCLNGLVFADRSPHPSLLEAKVVLQPVGIEAHDPARGLVRIINKHDFTNLSSLGVTWAVSIDGDDVESGSLEALDLEPGDSTLVRVPVSPVALDPGQVAHLTIRFDDVAVGQMEMGRAAHRVARGRVDVDIGGLEPAVALWRAPIDNETFSPLAARWAVLGLRETDIAMDTTIDGDHVRHEVVVPDELDDIPRVGVRLRLPPEVVAVDWVGRGPHESYTDRQRSALVGRWRTAVDEWHVPYVHPQASGNRTGVRSLRFLDASGAAVLTIDQLDDLDVTVSRWTDAEVADAAHLEDLPTRDHSYVWIDARHRGVGSGAVGPDTSAAHRIGPGTYRWTYRLRRGEGI